MPRNIPFVVDLDDAMYHRYDEHPLGLVRRLLGTKMDRLMQRSSAVVAGNRYIADRALAAGAPVVEVVPTVVDLDRYRVRECEVSPRPEFNVGWIGSPATAYNLQLMRLALERISTTHPTQLTTVGSGEVELGEGIHHVVRPWAEATELHEIHRLMWVRCPSVDSPFERGKSGFKLIQCMACGLPVIASPVGVNVEIVEHGVNGFLADTEEEWHAALEGICKQPNPASRHGDAGSPPS